MKVLVTGGAGYVGSHACKALAAAGITPVVYDNLSAGHQWAVKWGPLIVGDLCDGALLRETIRKHQVQAVLHFAAHSYVGESVENPRKYFRNNLVNTLELLDAMLDTRVRRIILSSTCATYGYPKFVPMHEGHAQLPVNPYGDTKLAIERALKWYGQAYGLEWVALRYFNAAGADPDGEIGESHDPETHLIPLVLEAVLSPHRPVSIFGTDYPTQDGTAIRDYIHVSDLAEAHVLALRYLQNGGNNDAFNLGTGFGHSVREVIAAVERVTGRKVAVIESGRRAGDPPVLVAAAARARNELHWNPRFSALDDIVASAWHWQRVSKVEPGIIGPAVPLTIPSTVWGDIA
jgi:UDP-glucose-4-epimerase GalE